MIWFIIRYTIFSIFVALTVYFVWKKKYEQLLWLYFFTFPFQNCAAYIITTWNPYKIVSLGMLFVIIFHRISRKLPAELRRLTYYFSFLLIAGNIIALFMPSSTAGLRGIIRLLVQNITYILGFVPIIYLKWLPRDFGKRVLKWYSAAICTLIGIGFIHYTFLKAGIPFAPIIRDVGMTNDVAATMFGSNVVNRIYGFCGEPKNMAFALVPFVLLILSKIFIGKEYNKRILFIGICALFILINTYSSAAYIEFFIGIVSVAYYALDRMNSKLKVLLISSSLLCCTLFYAHTLVELPNTEGADLKQEKTFVENLYDRSFGRAHSEIEEGRLEVQIFKDYIQSGNIVYYLFGYGPGQYSFHSQNLTFARGYIPVQSGLVLNLVDFGFFGFVYFIYLLLFVLKLYKKNKNNHNNLTLYFIIMGSAVLIGNTMYSMMGGSILIGMLLFIGMAYWINFNNTQIDIYND